MAKTTNMTEGPCVRLILTFAVPSLIGNLFQRLYSLADTMIVGRFLGDQAIAAVGATGILFSLLMDFTWGMNGGYGIVLSRLFGAGDRARFRNAAGITFVLNLLLAVVFTILSLLFLRPALALMKTPDDILEQAYRYIVIILCGMTTTVAYNACAGFLRAVGNSRVPLYFLIFSSILNLLLDVAFVAGLHTGVAGAALATVLSQGVSAVLCGIFIRKHYREYLPGRGEWLPRADILKEMLTSGSSMALMQSVVGLGSVTMQRSINELGTAIITAHTAGRRIIDLMMVPFSTVAISGSTFVGQNYGAGKHDRIAEANRKMLGIELIMTVAAFAVSLIIGRPLICWLTGTEDADIIANALLNLRVCTALFFPLGALFVLRYSMQATGHKILPVLSSSIELGVKFLFSLWLIPRLGYPGVVLTEPVIWCLCALFLGAAYGICGRRKPSTPVALPHRM